MPHRYPRTPKDPPVHAGFELQLQITQESFSPPARNAGYRNRDGLFDIYPDPVGLL